MTRKDARFQSKTRVVHYSFEGDIDLDTAECILRSGLHAGIVTQFDSNKSMERGMDVLWFEGQPGASLRALRARISCCVHPADATHPATNARST
jgi:hypothetical protein